MVKYREDKNKYKYDIMDACMPEFLERFIKIAKVDINQLPEGFAEELWDIYKGEEVYSKIIGNSICFTLEQIAYMEKEENEGFKTAYNRVKQRFYRKVKDGELVEGVDYYQIYLGDNMSLKTKGEKAVYITIFSLWKVLGTKERSKELASWFWYNMAKKVNNFMLTGETYMVNKEKQLVDQTLGDPKKNYVDCMGWRYSSKDEMFIGEVLHKIGIKFLPNSPINLSNEVKEHIKSEFSNGKPWDYITADFLILTEPRTVIEHWGIEGDNYYQWKRKIKTLIYGLFKIRVINIDPGEPQNKLGLKRRLEKELQQ